MKKVNFPHSIVAMRAVGVRAHCILSRVYDTQSHCLLLIYPGIYILSFLVAGKGQLDSLQAIIPMKLGV